MIKGLKIFCRLTLAWLMSLLSLLALASAEAETVVVLAGSDQWSLAGQLQVGPQGANLSAEELIKRPEVFEVHPGIPAWGFSDQTYWLRFSLQTPQLVTSDWLLQVAPPFTDYLTLYWQDADGKLQELNAGDLVQASRRPLNLPQQVFPIQLLPGQKQTFLLRVQGTNPLFADITVWTPEAYLQQSQRRNFYMSAYLATLALMTLLGVIYSFILRDRVYTYYTLYVLAQLGIQISHSGYLGWMLDLSWTRLPDLLTSGSIAVSLAFFALVFSRMTGMDRDYPHLSRFYLLLATGVAALGVFFVIQDRYALIATWMQLYILLLTAFSVVYSLFLILKKRYREGSAYLLIFGVLALGVLLRIFREQALLPNNFWTENAMYLGTLVHLVVMQVVITLKISRTRAATERELESRVEERTCELQKRHLELQLTHQENLKLQHSLQTSLEKEGRMRQAQQDFLNMVSKEFRSPLTVIDGSLALLDMQQHADPEIRKAWLDRIRVAQQRLAALVETSHWDQRLADEDWQPQMIQVQLRPWMSQMAENLRRVFNQRPVELQVDQDMGLETDPDLLKMLVHGLAEAVVQYADIKAPVLLQACIKEQYLELVVGVTGPSLEPRLAEQLTRRYSSHGNGSSQTSSGLYLAGAVARKLQGHLDYRILPAGACFLVSIPIQTKAETS